MDNIFRQFFWSKILIKECISFNKFLFCIATRMLIVPCVPLPENQIFKKITSCINLHRIFNIRLFNILSLKLLLQNP